MERNQKNIEAIDGLKGIAACIIAFVWHYQHFAQSPFVPFYNVFKVSYLRADNLVELFFCLSGFGMMLGYGQKIMEHKISFPQYIIRRIKKLYPLFLLTTVIVIVLEALIFAKTGGYFVYKNFDLYHLLLNLLLLQNGALETAWSLNSPSWVISVLMILYALFYLVCYVSKKTRIVYYVFFAIAICGSAVILNGENKALLNALLGRGWIFRCGGAASPEQIEPPVRRALSQASGAS